MTVDLTTSALLSSQKIKKEPSIVAVFDGITEVFGSVSILAPVLIGDAGLLIGGFNIGDTRAVDNQVTSITFESTGAGSTGTKINYNLNPDLGVAESITSLRLALVDTASNQILTLLSNNEFLGRKVRILLSPDAADTTYPDDYITIFRGIVDDISLPPGAVVFNISHPDQKKRQSIFTSSEIEAGEAIDISETTITLNDTSDLIDRITGPDGTKDDDYSTYIKVNDEVIQYTGISGNDLTGCVRGSLGTTAATHDLEDSVKSFYRLNGNAVELALKVMLSGWGGPFVEDVDVGNFNFLDAGTTVTNSMFFDGVNVEEVYGLTAGDYITTTGASDGANNVTDKVIESVTVTSLGSYIVITGVTFVDEFGTSGVVDFRSRYDTLGDGLGMSPDEVDVAEHTRLQTLFLSGFSHDIYLKDSVDNGRDFISNELYKPIACYAVPRQARSSISYTIGPLPTQSIKTLSTDNVLNANKLTTKRSLGRNFYNTIIYKYEEDAGFDIFKKGFLTTNATSKTQIPVGTRALTIISKGLRAANTVTSSATRLLQRYAFGANYINGIQVDFRTGFNLEVSDLILLDGASLLINDASTGLDTSPLKFYEIVSKDFNFRTGQVTLGIVDTNYSAAARYALISPASHVNAGISGTSFTIKESYASEHGASEFKKWEDYGEIYVRVRNETYGTSATAQIDGFSGNTVTLKTSLGFTPSADMIMELSDYSQADENIKLLYTHVTNGSADFADGGGPYVMV